MNPIRSAFAVLLLVGLALAQTWSPLHGMPGGHVTGAFDAVRGRAVVLAHIENGKCEPWEWTGSSWQRSAGGATVDLQQPGMVFDSARRRLVSFGTAWSFSQHSTYEWDRLQWTPRSLFWVGPSTRTDFAMTFDAARSRVLMFGGTGGGNELWTWDGATWNNVPRPNQWPSARAGAALAFDPVRQRTVLFGGGSWYWANVTALSDTWEWDGSSWTQLPIGGPPGRVLAAMAFDSASQRIVLFGGMGSTGRLDDTWEFDGTQWTQRAQAAGRPAARVRAALIDTPGGALLTGGQGNGDLDDTWQWSGGAWTRLGGDGAPPLMNHAMVRDEVRGELVAFGGTVQLYNLGSGTILQPAQGVWTWNGTWTHHLLTVQPQTRTSMGMAFDRARAVTVLFGGIAGGAAVGDTWLWNGTAWTQHLAGPQPAPRQSHGMVWDAARQKIVLFGGGTWSGATFQALGDTWTFDGTAWTQLSPLHSPPPQAGSRLAYDELRHVAVLRANGSTWEWDGTDWLSHSATTPSAHMLAWDGNLGRVVGFSTNDGQVMWTGTQWVTAPIAAVPTGYTFGQAFAWDPGRSRLLLHGGQLTQPVYETYGRVSNRLFANGPTPAAIAAYGAGCGGAGEPLLAATGRPSVGNAAFTLDAFAAQGGVAVLFAIGFTAGQQPVTPGCDLLLGDVAVAGLTIASPAGCARYPLGVPAVNALRGLHLHGQAGTLGANIAVSAGLRIDVGD